MHPGLTEGFVKAVRTPLWLFSTDGNRFKHPDAIAVARVLRSSTVPRTLPQVRRLMHNEGNT